MRNLFLILSALLLTAVANAATFGPPPDFTTNDPSYVITSVNTGAYGASNITVNGKWYGGKLTFVFINQVGIYKYYQAYPTTVTAADGTTATLGLFMHNWTTGSGRYITQHYAVDSGTVTVP